jgi:coenzyme F420-reducing hydrogenase delta subunit/formate hydrogenlyase subunit 6/NADH:ubiquinone oxidoreductase subunit I
MSKQSNDKFEPKIQALLCKWCASAGADLAGVSRMKYPSNLLPIQLMCSGRVDPIFILRAFEAGADGIFIGACHPGDCHYVDGNIKAKRRIGFLQEILRYLKLDDRLEFHYVSASEGRRFKELVTQYTEKIKLLGPSPIGSNHKITEFDFSDENRKKSIFHKQLTNLAKAVAFDPDTPIIFDIEQIMEGYGFPVRDAEKCIGCYACYNICPEHIISLNDIEETRIYGTLSHACRDCKLCEEVCPHNALEVKAGFDLTSFLFEIPVKDIEHPLLVCQKCDKPFTPIAQINHIHQTMNEKQVPNNIELPEDHFKLCPRCRRIRMGGTILEIVRTTTQYLTTGGD